jgi:hypothetical protein
MDTISLDGAVDFLPIDLLEIDSARDVGPYDSDDEPKSPPSPTYGVNGLLNVHVGSQKWQDKPSRI